MSSEEPWRNCRPWNAQLLHDLKTEVKGIKAPPSSKVGHLNVLLLGNIGAGKSSFFNTVASTFQDRLCLQADSGNSGTGDRSVTNIFRMYLVPDSQTGNPLNFRLCDTRGLEAKHENEYEFKLLLGGYLKDGYKFGTLLAREALLSRIIGYIRDLVYKFFKKLEKHPSYIESPTIADKMHCACFVQDSMTMDIMEESVKEKLVGFKKICDEKGTPCVVLLTKVDGLCPVVNSDVSKVFHSQRVKSVVEKAAEVYGVPENCVLPLANYKSSDGDISDNVGILAILSLKTMLGRSVDHLRNQFDYDHGARDVPENQFVINMPS